MRVAGGGWEEIARALGMKGGAPAAYRAVKNYFGSVPQPDREMLREIARQRGERLWMRAAAAVEEQPSPAAIRAAVAVLDRAAKLDGLDQPTRVAVAPDNDTFESFIATVAKSAGLELPVEANPFDPIYVLDEDVETTEDGSSS